MRPIRGFTSGRLMCVNVPMWIEDGIGLLICERSDTLLRVVLRSGRTAAEDMTLFFAQRQEVSRGCFELVSRHPGVRTGPSEARGGRKTKIVKRRPTEIS